MDASWCQPVVLGRVSVCFQSVVLGGVVLLASSICAGLHLHEVWAVPFGRYQPSIGQRTRWGLSLLILALVLTDGLLLACGAGPGVAQQQQQQQQDTKQQENNRPPRMQEQKKSLLIHPHLQKNSVHAIQLDTLRSLRISTDATSHPDGPHRPNDDGDVTLDKSTTVEVESPGNEDPLHPPPYSHGKYPHLIVILLGVGVACEAAAWALNLGVLFADYQRALPNSWKCRGFWIVALLAHCVRAYAVFAAVASADSNNNNNSSSNSNSSNSNNQREAVLPALSVQGSMFITCLVRLVLEFSLVILGLLPGENPVDVYLDDLDDLGPSEASLSLSLSLSLSHTGPDSTLRYSTFTSPSRASNTTGTTNYNNNNNSSNNGNSNGNNKTRQGRPGKHPPRSPALNLATSPINDAAGPTDAPTDALVPAASPSFGMSNAKQPYSSYQYNNGTSYQQGPPLSGLLLYAEPGAAEPTLPGAVLGAAPKARPFPASPARPPKSPLKAAPGHDAVACGYDAVGCGYEAPADPRGRRARKYHDPGPEGTPLLPITRPAVGTCCALSETLCGASACACRANNARAAGLWANRSLTVVFRPAKVLVPASVDELLVQVEWVGQQHGGKLRAVGRGHSSSVATALPAGGHLVDMTLLTRLLDVDVRAATVRVEAGVRLSALSAALAENDLALPALAGLGGERSLGGVLALGPTARPGGGLRVPALHAAVVALELVGPDGSLATITAATDPLLFRAARLSLGALGIIYSATLQCEPACRLDCRTECLPLASAAPRLAALARERDAVSALWYPHTDHLVVLAASRTARPRSRVPAAQAAQAGRAARALPARLLSALHRHPQRLPAILRAHVASLREDAFVDAPEAVFGDRGVWGQAQGARDPAAHRPGRGDDQGPGLAVVSCEYLIPVASAATAIDRARDVASAALEQHAFHPNLPVAVTFVAGDDALLSPTAGVACCSIEARSLAAARGWEAYFDMFEAAMLELGGRPGWDAVHGLGPYDTQPFPGAHSFASIRNRVDPHGVFLTEHVAEALLAMTAPERRSSRASSSVTNYTNF